MAQVSAFLHEEFIMPKINTPKDLGGHCESALWNFSTTTETVNTKGILLSEHRRHEKLSMNPTERMDIE